MKTSMQHEIEREMEKIAKPVLGASIPQLQAQRHRLEGFGRAVMLYGDIPEIEFLQLRRDAYVAFARGTSHVLAQLSAATGENPTSSSQDEEIELFGSIEAANRAFRAK